MAERDPTYLPDALAPLRDLALDLRWTWSHEADDLWTRVDPELWEQSHSPWGLLQTVSRASLDRLASDAGFRSDLRALVAKRDAYDARPTWFASTGAASRLGGVAYFSLEFGLGAALPLYAGGLGVLAGDYLKAASDLGAPVVGVGLLYQEGYFRQVLDADGDQREAYPYNEPATLPIEPALVDGVWLRVPVGLPGRELLLRVWRAKVGRVDLLLLDSNDTRNSPSDRAVTGKLYGGDAEMRLLQELALGVGGWRALCALGIDVEVCHINEGHAAFAVVERARSLAARADLGFSEALWATRAGNVFTTHTPVASGFDQFPPDLIGKYLPALLGDPPPRGSSTAEVLALGRARPGDAGEPFNMAYLALRGSAWCFAVSRLHQQVSRRIFQPLFPRWPEREVPVDQITNGVHTPTWDSAQADRLWTEACGKDRWREDIGELPDRIAQVSDEAIWAMRGESRDDLVGHVRRRLAVQFGARGSDPDAARSAMTAFDPNVLTLGFARRFTDYKRPNLLLRDPERLARILLDEQRPVQIVVAGKAHPDDAPGKAMIREWIALARRPLLRRRIVFLEDYDLGLAQELVQGVDVWINTPRRPWEACGTSGMKVLVNGGLNCSVRDGWWDQAYDPGLGWSIGLGTDGDVARLDATEAAAAYDLIEHRIAPEFYDRDAEGLPRAWLARIRRSMSTLTSRFSSSRMIGEYLDAAYLPAASELRRRQADGCAAAKDLADWSARLARAWGGLHIGAPTVELGDRGAWFTVPVLFDEVRPDDVRVELFADPADDEAPAPIRLERGQAIPGSVNGFVYAGAAPASRPAADFSVRVVPADDRGARPSERVPIAWQR